MNVVSRLAATLAASAVLATSAMVATAPSAAAVVPVEGTVVVKARKVTNKPLARTYADQWDAWVTYNRALTDGCWDDFVSSPRALVRSSRVDDELVSESSRIHRGWSWQFGVGDGCA